MDLQVIAFDLDGTLLTSNKQILPESIAAIHEVQKQGLQVVIVSGRHHMSIKPFHAQLELITPAVSCNGSYLYDFQENKIVHGNPLTSFQAKEILRILKSNSEISLLAYTDHAMAYEKLNPSVKQWLKWVNTLPPEVRPNVLQVNHLEETANAHSSVWKIAIVSENIPLLRNLGKEISEMFDVASELSAHNQMDIFQKGNSKELSLEYWLQTQGLTLENVVAFGDNYNDISMLASVGMGIAMGNSHDDIKQHAKLIIGNNEVPSIAETLHKLFVK